MAFTYISFLKLFSVLLEMRHLILQVFLLISLLMPVHGQNQLTVPKYETLRNEFIIKNAPFRQCHASTLVELSSGEMMVAWFAGSYESAPDVKIWGSMFKNSQWTDPFLLADGKIEDSLTYPCWNPVLFKTTIGRLYLFYKVGKNPREWVGMMKHSENNGITWSGPEQLPAGVLGPIKNKPVELPNGDLLCPSSTETLSQWSVQMELFHPRINRWEVVPVDPGSSYQVIQPTILINPDSSIRILCRSKSNVVIQSASDDQGRSWSPLTPTGLVNPNAGIDGLTLGDGSHLLVYNPLVSGTEWVQGRNRLNLAWTADGNTWADILVLENEESGEFSYPAIIGTSDGSVHITYTYNREQIRYLQLRTGSN
jgi:alpha-L-fucosidase